MIVHSQQKMYREIPFLVLVENRTRMLKFNCGSSTKNGGHFLLRMRVCKNQALSCYSSVDLNIIEIMDKVVIEMKYKKEDELFEELSCEELSVMETKAVDSKKEELEDMQWTKECHLR